MDAALQKRRREEHLAAMRQGLVPSMSMSECCVLLLLVILWLKSRFLFCPLIWPICPLS
jgi:hypothetical protein